MNYQVHYTRLILNAKSREVVGYVEVHHILPRCLGGSDDRDNLVRLTPREHYVAHQILVKLHPGNLSLVRAANMMTLGPRGNRVGNREYGWLKVKQAEATSILSKRLWADPDYRDNLKRRQIEYWADPTNRTKHGESAKRRADLSKLSERTTARNVERWSIQENRDKQAAATRDQMANPDRKAAQSKHSLEFFSTEENKAKHSAGIKRAQQEQRESGVWDAARDKQRATMKDPAIRKRIADAKREWWAKKRESGEYAEHCAKISAGTKSAMGDPTLRSHLSTAAKNRKVGT